MVKSYKKEKPTGNYDAIIIGSGLGGMTTGVFLAKEGKKVLILERHYTPGGFTHVFKRRGYEWDVGVHYVGEFHRDSTMVAAMFRYITEGRLKWADMGEVYDKMIFGTTVYDYAKGVDNFKARMKEYFPAPKDQASIDLYVDKIYEAQKAQQGYFMEKALPDAARFIMGNNLRKKGLKYNRPTSEVMADITSNKKLTAVLTGQFGDYGLPPTESSFMMHSALVKHYFNGGYYPIGGSSKIFECVEPTITERGGEIYTNAEVSEILVEGNKAVGVKMKDGDIYKAPLIISSAGLRVTYNQLLPQGIKEKKNLQGQLDKVKPSVGHVCLYLGFEHSTEELGLQKANYWIFPDNYDHDKNIKEYLKNPDAEIPVVYVSFPSAKDPSWDERYPGKATIDIITLAPWDRYTKWDGTRWMKRGEDYNEAKEKLSQRLMEKLFSVEPQLRGKISHYELSTPLTTKHFANYMDGELYGLDHTLERFDQKFLRPKTPVKNLYLTGQDVVTVGVGGALASGMVTASAILKKNLSNRLKNA